MWRFCLLTLCSLQAKFSLCEVFTVRTLCSVQLQRRLDTVEVHDLIHALFHVSQALVVNVSHMTFVWHCQSARKACHVVVASEDRKEVTTGKVGHVEPEMCSIFRVRTVASCAMFPHLLSEDTVKQAVLSEGRLVGTSARMDWHVALVCPRASATNNLSLNFGGQAT